MSSTFKDWLSRTSRDPLVKILLAGSNLTSTQLETFLLHLLTENPPLNHKTFEEKASFRLRGRISRGSFNRSLRQSQRNVVRSIYTILLLGYLGVLETPALTQYVELSGKISSIMEAYKDRKNLNEHPEIFRKLRTELHKAIASFIEPKKLTNRL